MRYVAAYCLSAMGGGSPSVKDIEKILSSVGVDCDAAKAKKVVDELSGKKLSELIEEGKTKIGSVPSAAPVASSQAVETAVAPAKEEKKKEEEPEEESDDDMGFGLFD